MSLEMRIPLVENRETNPTEIRRPLRQTTPGAARQVIVRRLDRGGYYVGVGQGWLYLSPQAAEGLLIALANILIAPRPGQVRR